MAAANGTIKELSETQFLNVLRERPKQPTAFIVDFTAKGAGIILERHGKLNRKISPSHFHQLGNDMVAELWDLNGEPVIFDVNGTLEDGYHRLTGCAMYQTHFKTLVTLGVLKDSWKSIDQGRTRSLSNVLEFQGVDKKASGKLQALIRFCIIYEQNADRTMSVSGPTGLAWFKKNPSIADSVNLMKQARSARIGLKPTIVAGVHFEAIKTGHSPEAVNGFFGKLINGLGLTEGDPAATLRKKMVISVTSTKNGVSSALTEHQQKYMITRALNASLKGETMKQARAPRKGEEMPRIIKPVA